MKNKLITSALPYVNNQPHLGNVIGCVLSSDVYSRYCKKSGYNTIHVCGTDEYGTAIEMAAMAVNKHPKEICDSNHIDHKRIYNWFDIDFDYFGRTTSADHSKETQEFFLRIYENGYFEEKETEQFFCEGCNIFLADRYVKGTCFYCKGTEAKGDQCDECGKILKNTELIDPECTMCKSKPIFKHTKHLFLRLDQLKDQLNEYLDSKIPLFTSNAQEITKEWLKKELLPRCITRDLKNKWGVKVPIPGFESKVLYVWFDAPIGYITFSKALLGEKYDDFITDCDIIQFMGKDNVSFHSVFFPSMCIASQTNFLVDKISATEYLMFENKKFSKSRNHGIFGLDLVDDRFGKSSFWRYYLLKIRPEGKDSNFSYSDFKVSVTSDLINNIGNFINRTLKFINSKLNGTISYGKNDEVLISEVDQLYLKYRKHMENIELRPGLKIILEVSSYGNEYLQKAIVDKENRGESFSRAVSVVAIIAHMIAPILPRESLKIFKMIQVEDYLEFPENFKMLSSGHKISADIVPLFMPFTEVELSMLR